jgi:hypothetical protein
LVVSFLPEPETHPLWPEILKLLQPAADFGEIPAWTGDECVWIAFEGQTLFAAATTILWDDGEAELLLAGGHRHKDWMGQLDATVTAWARDCGARKITMRGRRGWTRYAARFGWGVSGCEGGRQIYEKEL